ncbi:YoaH family protein [Providencia stuartii]|uniref:YoaH family protein n=1 Tax=Providencia TaxID=586 RepID=UPI0034D557B6
MFSGMPALNHQQQQEAVERIHQLMADGMSSGEAIALVAQEIRERYKDKEQIQVRFDEENEL